MKSIAAATVLAVSLMGTAAFAGPNLVTNGSFNSSVYTVNTQFGTAFGQTNQQGVTGWTGNNGYDLFFTSASASSTQNSVGQYSSTGLEKLYGPVPASPDGGSFIGLDGEQTVGVQGGVSQTINGLIIGDSYQLSFDWGAGQVQSRTGMTTEQLQASLGGQSFLTSVVNNPSGGFTGWMTQTFTFTANSTSELLSFLSIGTPLGLPPMAVLDGVSLTQVPEPMSLALLSAGLIGLGIVRSRRKS
jgi:hypothetical protein